VVLRATVAAGTSVSVETFTSEAERPADHVAALAQERWATGAVHADPAAERWDCLVQSPPGRHLWLRLRLTGSGAETARVHDVEVELPRQTSLRFLPAVYREDPVSADFLERMLAIFDTIRDGVGGRLDDMPRNLDPRGAPAEPIDAGGVDFLSWLASWMGLALERHWTEDRRRRLVEHAHRLYALRGTPAGLALHLRLYTGVEPRIVEHYKLRRWAFLGSARLGAAAELYGQAVTARLQLGEGSRVGTFALVDTGDPQRDPLLQQAHRMTVFVPLARRDVAQVRTIERIVELATPAHVQADVKVIDPGFRVGTHALLGIDTALGRAPDSVRLRSGRLGSDTVLAAGGRRASRRIGFTTVVE
jgi:phage tail-like protein